MRFFDYSGETVEVSNLIKKVDGGLPGETDSGPDTPGLLRMDARFEDFLIDGWHRPEIWDVGTVRWTEPDFRFRIMAAGQLEIEALVDHPDITQRNVPFRAMVGDVSVYESVLRKRGWQTIRIPLKGFDHPSLCNCRLVLDRGWSPAEIGTRDARNLGLAVLRISSGDSSRLLSESMPSPEFKNLPEIPPDSTVSVKTRFRWLKLLVEKLIRFHTREQGYFNKGIREAVVELRNHQEVVASHLRISGRETGEIRETLANAESAIRGLAAGIENARAESLDRMGALSSLEAGIRSLALSIDNVHREFTSRFDELRIGALTERLTLAERDIRRLTQAPQAVVPIAPKSGAPTAAESVDNSSTPAVDYFWFESRFRGPETEIKERQRRYADYFKGKKQILDLACGRGEFLEVLRDIGQHGTGVDLSPDNVALAKSKGLDVLRSDAFEYVRALKDESLDGVFCAQFVEHLAPPRFVELNRLVFAKLKLGGILIAETLNPATLSVHASALYMDLSHEKPVHPMTFQFLLESMGYTKVDLLFSSPVEESRRLPRLEGAGESIVRFNNGVDALNNLLYGPQDYAVIAVK